jgi:hypothetical protein
VILSNLSCILSCIYQTACYVQSEVADGITSSPIASNDEPKEDNEVSATTTEESSPASSDNSPQQSELRRRRVAALEIKTETKSEK